MNYEWDVSRARRTRLAKIGITFLAATFLFAVPVWFAVHMGLAG